MFILNCSPDSTTQAMQNNAQAINEMQNKANISKLFSWEPFSKLVGTRFKTDFQAGQNICGEEKQFDK